MGSVAVPRKILAGLFWALVVALAPGLCLAEGGCSVEAAAPPWVLLRNDQQKRIVYRLSVNGQKWRMGTLGLHVTATIDCSNCTSGQSVHAIVWFDIADKQLQRPDISVLQQEIDAQSLVFDWMTAPFDSGKVLGEPHAITISGFSGWQANFVVERVMADGALERHNVVSVTASDGCVSVRLRIESKPSEIAQPIADVQELISSVQISRADAVDDPEMKSFLQKP